MLKPPFKLASPLSLTATTPSTLRAAPCCEADAEAADDASAEAPTARGRLADLDPHLHCSVIGTCLGTAELRKLMARFLFVRDASDLEVHHEAVRLAAQGGPVVKALHKALDQRHEAVVQRLGRVHGAPALELEWNEAMRQGEIPGAYWGVLTHRDVTPALRQKVFGDVHMLSHLVGAANRADIRRLVALEHENAELRERAERQALRAQELADERERAIARLRQELADARAERERLGQRHARDAAPSDDTALRSTLAMVGVQTERRERAEQAATVAGAEAARLREELEHLARHTQTLGRELLAAETQLREIGAADAAVDGAPGRALARQLQGQRVFYVGGRPSSTPAIRDLVLRHGGEFQHHDGGLEDRKGLLASGVAWARLVVFPVDCVDHDSATNLKRLCVRQSVAYLPLRGASVASFVAALAELRPDEINHNEGDQA
ncbi:MAG TPA: DUF2325 domain-containing protein [Burkholderiaceae bacterium]|jgi:hypothetical protein